VPRTVPKRLYKRAQQAHKTDSSAFILTADVLAPTVVEIAAIEAKTSNTALN